MEHEPGDEADNAEDEPSLGSLDPPAVNGRKVHVTIPNMSTRREPDDSGIGDQDRLVEQVGRQDWQAIFFV